MESIFISYRREDTMAQAIAIKEKLDNVMPDQVFMDLGSIEPGRDWQIEIKRSLDEATIILVLIGDRWFCHDTRSKRRRIDDEDDWVRLELSYAINKNKIVIPVLINGMEMPSEDSLPDDIKGLTRYQALGLNQNNWNNDLNHLLKIIQTPQKARCSVIVTSTSPRRKALLKQIGWEDKVDYDTWPASVQLNRKTEDISLADAKIFTQATTYKKIRVVASELSVIRKKKGKDFNRNRTIIVGVDTTVFCRNKILDRPLIVSFDYADDTDKAIAKEKAKKMLLEQRGQQVQVITCIAVALASDLENIRYETVITKAQLRNYSDDDIDNYITSAEPFDKAGAFGIQEKGVSLFDSIIGSYSNIVGLPLNEFTTLLRNSYGDLFKFSPFKSTLRNEVGDLFPNLSTVSIGDINYDFIYDYLPEGFFVDLKAPGKKKKGEIYRGAGGTAVNFAKGAKISGFNTNCVVGIVGSDGLGSDIREELLEKEITLLPDTSPINQKTSIAIILRDIAKEDVSLTLTDARQKLPTNVVEQTKKTIEIADVFYCSGYALIDTNRREYVQEMLEIANKSGCIVVLDVVVGMNQVDEFSTYVKFKNRIQYARKNKLCVDVLVSELKEIFTWFNIDCFDDELKAWEANKKIITKKLRNDFPVIILRTSKYTHELILTPHEVLGPYKLEYNSLLSREKLGYGDIRTACLVYEYLSPRIILASKSPQRFQLLEQIIAPEKIQVQVSQIDESYSNDKSPQDRVIRLAETKAKEILDRGEYGDNIEFIIGADTEIISKWEMIGHPRTTTDVKRDLRLLSGKTHQAITGIAVIGVDPKSGTLLTISECVSTDVSIADLSEEQIESYANSEEPFNRAGAYAIQGLGALIIESIRGSYSNVVGLPLERLSQILAEKFEKPIWDFNKVSNWSKPNSLKKVTRK